MDARAQRKSFIDGLGTGVRVVWPVLSMLIAVMLALGVTVGVIEGWSVQDSVYFAFISGLTIGYGDLAPTRLSTRAMAVAIGLCGILLTALLAAIAVKALTSIRED